MQFCVGAEVTALDVLSVEGEDEPFELEAYFRDDPREAEGVASGGEGEEGRSE